MMRAPASSRTVEAWAPGARNCWSPADAVAARTTSEGRHGEVARQRRTSPRAAMREIRFQAQRGTRCGWIRRDASSPSRDSTTRPGATRRSRARRTLGIRPRASSRPRSRPSKTRSAPCAAVAIHWIADPSHVSVAAPARAARCRAEDAVDRTPRRCRLSRARPHLGGSAKHDHAYRSSNVAEATPRSVGEFIP